MPGSKLSMHPPHHLHWWTDIHRSAAVNIRLGMTLSFIAGATNAGGFLAIGHYTSHMTGLLSSVADHLVLGQFGLVMASLAAIAAFIGGAMTTAMMVNWGMRRQLRSAFARPLVLETGLLLVFGLFGAAIHLHAELFAPLTVLLLCYIMGLQNAVITKMSSAEIRTTHMTGICTDIGIELGKALYWNRGGRPAHEQVHVNHKRLRLFASLLSMFMAGGVVGAAGFKYVGFIWVVPLATVLLVLSLPPLAADFDRLGLAWRRRSSRGQ